MYVDLTFCNRWNQILFQIFGEIYMLIKFEWEDIDIKTKFYIELGWQGSKICSYPQVGKIIAEYYFGL